MRRSIPIVLCLAVLISTSVRSRAGETDKHRQTLGKLVTIKVEDATLREIVDSLSKQAGVELQIDEREVAALLDIDADRLTGNLKNLPLRSAFKFLADGVLTLQTRDDGLIVTTWEAAEEADLETEFFDVLDLVRDDETVSPDDYDYKTVIELMMTTIDPETWDEFGGRGSIRRIRGLLMVNNRRDLLDEIPQLLGGFRKACKLAAGEEREAVSVPLSNSPTDNVSRALVRPFDLDFADTPLSEVISRLQEVYSLTVILSPTSINDGLVDPETPVTLVGKMQPLHEALNQLADVLSLEWSVLDGAVVFEEYAANLGTRAYPVNDLLGEFLAGDEFDEHRREFDYDDLIELTTSSVAEEDWDEVGGPGSITALPSRGLLIVSQFWSNHRAVERFLTKLRKELSGRPRVAEKPTKKAAEQMRVAVYVFATPDLEVLRKAELAADQKQRSRAAQKKEQAERDKAKQGARKPADTPPPDGLPPVKKLDDDPFGPGEPDLDPFGEDGFGGGGFGDDGFGDDGFGDDGHVDDPLATPRSFYIQERPITEEQLVETITGLIEPASWVRDEKTFIKSVHGRIVVRHTNAMHTKIHELAKRLRIKEFRELTPADYDSGFGGGFGGGPENGGFF